MSDKRRGGSGRGASLSHVLRTTSAAMASSTAPSTSSPGSSGASAAASAAASTAVPTAASSTSSSSSSSSAAAAPAPTASGNRNNIISPPPRAALSGSSAGAVANQADERGHSASGAAQTSGGGSTISPQQHRDAKKDAKKDSRKDAAKKDGKPGSNGVGANTPASAAHAALSAAAAATQLVKEKDLRIAALERELGTMEAEFGRELDKLSQNESEAAAFWQAKHSSLNQQFLRADTELRLLRNAAEVREAERGELAASWEAMRREVAERDAEIRELRAQVRGLKDWVSTSTRSAGAPATSDEVFADGMARLGNGLQNWVIVNFRRMRLDMTRASEPVREDLNRLVPTFEELAHTSKLHLLQSLVSRILVEMVFDSYFVGLTAEQESRITQTEMLLADFSSRTEPVNQWRSATLTILNKEASQKMKDATSRLTESVVSRVNQILDEVAVMADAASTRTATPPPPPPKKTSATATGTAATTVTAPSATEARDNGLRHLVSTAVDLSRLLVVQRACFIVLMPEVLPHQRTPFDPETMEDIMGGHDEDSLGAAGDEDDAAEVRCVTFPGILKRGDESGGGLQQYENVICKVKVVCNPD